MTEKRTTKLYRQKTGKSLIYYTTANGSTALKRCTDCGHARPITEFNKGEDSFGKRYECRTCTRKNDKQYSRSSHGRVLRFLRNSRWNVHEAKSKFGITIEDTLKPYDVAMIQGNDECCYCGRQLEPGEVTVDHVLPFKQGGANNYRNLLPCCRSCNARKGDKTLHEFLSEHVDEYHRRQVVFTLAQKHVVTYDQMLEQIKLDRVFNLYLQPWETLQREGLTHLFKNKADFENQRRTYYERIGKASTQGE